MPLEMPKPEPRALERLNEVYIRRDAVEFEKRLKIKREVEQILKAERLEAERRHKIIELLSIYGTNPALVTALRDRSLRGILTYFGEFQPARKKHTFIPIYGFSVFSIEKQYQIIPDENKLEFQHLVMTDQGILIIKKPSPVELGNPTKIESVTRVTEDSAWYFDEGNILGPPVKPEFVAEKLADAVNDFADGIEQHTWLNEV